MVQFPTAVAWHALFSGTSLEWTGYVKSGMAMAVALSVCGCSTIDHFAPRAERFNVQAADSKSRTIIANVVRAAYGQPLQFSDVSTVTGQAVLGGELGATLPVSVTPKSATTTYSLAPTVSASGTSTFNTVNLNTREFYLALQTPVSVKQIANFNASGYDPKLVLFLIVSDIEIKQDDRRVVFHSSAATPENYRLFYQAISFLVDAGLDTRQGKASGFGPSLTSAQIADPKVISTLLSSAGGDLSLKEEEGKTGSYRFYSKGSLEFCFDPLKATAVPTRKAYATTLTEKLDFRTLLNSASPAAIPTVLVMNGKAAFADATFNIPPTSFCDPPAGAIKGTGAEISIRTRSVEGIFQFLGGVAREQLGLSVREDGAAVDGLSLQSSDGKVFTPFRVIHGVPTNAALTIYEGGRYYSVATDATGTVDQTTRVMQIVTDLLAIQSSAKDLPAPNLISILGR